VTATKATKPATIRPLQRLLRFKLCPHTVCEIFNDPIYLPGDLSVHFSRKIGEKSSGVIPNGTSVHLPKAPIDVAPRIEFPRIPTGKVTKVTTFSILYF
jgi:hypothetical protein